MSNEVDFRDAKAYIRRKRGLQRTAGKVCMRHLFIASLFVGIVLGWPASQALAQETKSTPSLAELAKRLRAQREKASQKPVKVFTNDNLPARPTSESSAAATGLSDTTQKESKSEASTTEEKSPEGDHNEKYYRKRMKELQDQLDLHKRELAVLEQKGGDQLQMFTTDPNKNLQQTSTPAYAADQAKLQDQLQKKRDQIAEDQKAMDDLRDQLRREGGDPGWLR